MANFSLFETFFFLTLAITFILILLLVYHFKDRLSKLEQKSDSMFNIIYNISDEMTKAQNRNDIILGPSLDHYHNSTMCEDAGIMDVGGSLALTEPEFDVKRIENINLNLQSDTEDNLSESSESDNEDDNESDEDDNESDEDDETTIEKIDVPSMDLDYKKMPVGELRELVQSKGLAEDAKKLKKNELIALLQ